MSEVKCHAGECFPGCCCCEHHEDTMDGKGKVSCLRCGARLPERDFVDTYPGVTTAEDSAAAQSEKGTVKDE